MIQLTARNATIEDLQVLLHDQRARKVDVVVRPDQVRSENGILVIEDTEPIMDAAGLTYTAGRYRPMDTCDEGVAAKLHVPLAYLRKMREERPDLYDDNVNGWLHGGAAEGGDVVYPPDKRRFLLRCFRGDGEDPAVDGLARAFLSNKFKLIDYLDTLLSALQGAHESGVELEVVKCNLTARRMYVHVFAPEVATLAPELLEGYRPPGSQVPGKPVVFSGFEIRNSEIGAGMAEIVPKFWTPICSNGITIEKDALGKRHAGAAMDDGLIDYAEDTQHTALELVKLQARDAVKSFLDPKYLARQIAEIEGQAGVELEDPKATVEHVAEKLTFSQAEADGILKHFIRGKQSTAGGVLNAVTSFSQTVEDADRASELDGLALRALELAAA